VAWVTARNNQPLALSSPDQGVAYRLDANLPRDAQRIEVTAYAGVGISPAEVTLWVDGQLLARVGAPPYSALWRLEPGRHRFWAEGLTKAGEQLTSDEVWIEVRE
jgi:hypothetical protein